MDDEQLERVAIPESHWLVTVVHVFHDQLYVSHRMVSDSVADRVGMDAFRDMVERNVEQVRRAERLAEVGEE